MRKLICKDFTCKHNGDNNVCQKKTVEIDLAQCQSYEKGFHYYLQLVYGKLSNTNMIPLNELNEELKIGLYYVMEIFDLGFSQCEYGTWRWVMLKDGETGKGLKSAEIRKREINTEKLMKHFNNFNNGIVPNQGAKKEEPKKTSQPFGWLSPTGEFTEGDFGEHEKAAWYIIKNKKFVSEFDSNGLHTARDFLSEIKGYVLIHNPFCDGGYIVSHVKPLTKKQKEFLYGYFMDLGDKWKAEQYLED
jgi:hypothetical protein